MLMEDSEPCNVVGFVPAGLARAMKGNARLKCRRKSRLAHHPKARIDVTLVPVVVRVKILFPLTDHKAIVHYRLLRMGDQISICRVERRPMVEIIRYGFEVEVVTNERGQTGLVGSIKHPETCSLAVGEGDEFAEHCRPQRLVHCRIIKALYGR